MNITQNKNIASNENSTINMVNEDIECLPKIIGMILESMHYANEYTKTRPYEHTGLTEAGVTMFGLARLSWLLDEGRQELINLFTPSEFATLSSALQDEICSPSSIMNLVDIVGNELGLEPDAFEGSYHASLMHKLLSLTSLQSLALRDLLEEYWHVGMHKMTCAEFLNNKGLS